MKKKRNEKTFGDRKTTAGLQVELSATGHKRWVSKEEEWEWGGGEKFVIVLVFRHLHIILFKLQVCLGR